VDIKYGVTTFSRCDVCAMCVRENKSMSPHSRESNQISTFANDVYYYFLADRTNGRAIGTVLRLSVVCL